MKQPAKHFLTLIGLAFLVMMYAVGIFAAAVGTYVILGGIS